MGILIKGMDEIPEDGAVLVVKHDNGKAYIKHACTYGYSMELVKLPAAQPDHNADSDKKVSISYDHESDLISRQATIDLVGDWIYNPEDLRYHKDVINSIPAAQPNHIADISKKVSISCGHENDLISRQMAIDALKGLPTWWADEGGYYGGAQPPMVALLDPEDAVSAIENLPSVQPETNCSEIPNSSTDCISRQAAIDTLARMMPRSYTPDGSHPADEEIFRAQEVFADCIEALEILPPAQPETATVTIGRTKGGVTMWYECDACGEPIDQKDCYCRNCGRKLTIPEPYRGGDA